MRLRTLFWVVLLTSAIPMWGQTLGEITGEVRDSSSAIVEGASVTLANQATGAARNGVTNQVGVYSFPSLPPGVYNLRVEKAGFQIVTRDNIELHVQQTARVNFTLNVGQVTEVIEVTGGAPLMTTESATVGTVIENRRIVELPLNGRNFLQLVSLAPNVSFGFGASSVGATGDRSRFSSISIGGQRPVFNHYTLDGVENTYVEGNSYAFLPSIDALGEFKVQTGVYPAEFGRAVSQINVSMKSGGNEYHGALFEFIRNDKLDATNYAFTTARPPKDPFRWNQYGFTLGGPIRIPKIYDGRNRLFFMANFEGFRDRRRGRVFSDVASLAMREGDFSGIQPRIFDPRSHVRQPDGTITAQPFLNNRIPGTLVAGTSVKLLEFLPAPNQPGPSLVANYQAAQSGVVDKDQFNLRIDAIESDSSNWFGRYSWSDELQLNEGLKLNGSKSLNNPWQAVISNTRMFSPVLVNEFRFAATRFTNNGVGELAFERDVVSELNIPGVSKSSPEAWGIPVITTSGLSGFGGAPGGTVRYSTLFQWVDNVSWVHGKHTLRFGAEFRRDRWNASQYTFGVGQFDFFGSGTQDPGARAQTGFAFADFMTGYVGNSRAGVTQAFAKFRATSQAYYVDETWKALPNLTITLGLRYEISPPWYDQSERFINAEIPFADTAANVDPSRHPTLVRIGSGDFYEGVAFRFNPAIRIARDGRLGKSGVATDFNDIGPRVGISWSPTANWTIRTGGGVFYSQDTSAPKLDPARNLAGFRSEQASTDFPNLTWEAPFIGLGQAVQVNTPSVLSNDPLRRTPYTIQYLLNVQRQLTEDTVLEVGYLGSVARKLEQYRNFNRPDPSPIGSISSRAPYPEFGRVFQVAAFGKANYNSFAAKLQRRFSAGLTFLSAYTWSTTIDTGSGIRTPVGDTLFMQDERCQQCDRALSTFHTAHRFVTSTLYELPFGSGKRYLNRGGIANAILGGWQIGSILTLQTGFPVNVFAGNDQCNCGGQADRVNATGEATALPRGEQDPVRFFNTGAYALQPFGSYGNSGRNTLIGPGIISWDFSTRKEFPIGEARLLEFRFEAFNLPNHPNWAPPNSTFVSASFGKVLSTRTAMRSLQFALKLIF